VLYQLSHGPSNFAFTIFFEVGSHIFVQASLKLQSSYLCLPSSWDYKSVNSMPGLFLRQGFANFLPNFTSIQDPPPE
jgi:hypothetical protein